METRTENLQRDRGPTWEFEFRRFLQPKFFTETSLLPCFIICRIEHGGATTTYLSFPDFIHGCFFPVSHQKRVPVTGHRVLPVYTGTRMRSGTTATRDYKQPMGCASGGFIKTHFFAFPGSDSFCLRRFLHYLSTRTTSLLCSYSYIKPKKCSGDLNTCFCPVKETKQDFFKNVTIYSFSHSWKRDKKENKIDQKSLLLSSIQVWF